ncbi:phosphatidylcholine transfer protein isoform X2 [Erinaceus europaeus]|uniref:Phosphatidylcholine transfer protein isoform X2 n=1 Tax=Erinaceus europaeus TaxID=9365 RepID=A0ABM3YFB0_ERIEU|nr:phosphatidylcholine transfer protein isoform X2 [Erinaceus europaeus]
MMAHSAAGGFLEEQFRAVCAEFQKHELGGADWELLVDTLGIKVFRLRNQSGLYEYKVFGVLEDCPPDVLADVYMDLNYRKQWDSYVKELYEEECDGKNVVYWEVNYPFPMSNRDYVYIRDCRELDWEGQKVYVVLAKSVEVPQFPEKSGVVRVKQYKQSLALVSDGKKGSRDLTLAYIGEHEVVNTIQLEKTILPSFNNHILWTGNTSIHLVGQFLYA